MPKAMQYSKGSIVYFEGDKDEQIFILQKGMVILTSTDIETGVTVTEHIKEGEFFGVKSAFGHFPREETATVLSDSFAISMNVAEFEKLFTANKALIMKMLRVFSNQLRTIHRKIESVLKSSVSVDQPSGMMEVANSFYNDEQYKACCDICLKLLKRFPAAHNKEAVAKLYTGSKMRAEKMSKRQTQPTLTANLGTGAASAEAALKAFSLPAFARFAKEFDQGTVIIAEYEPGDTFYLIQDGFVQLAKCVNGSKKNLDILRPGEVFGEMAILENSPRSATCVAATKVKALEFNKENFELLITGNPQMALILLRLFCKRIYDQKRRFRILCMTDLQARIADVFLMFDEMNPVFNPNERSRRFNLTVQDVAHWAGLPVGVARDEVGKYTEKRKLEVQDNYIVVTNILDFRRIVDQRIQLRRSNMKT
jgi:CRP-like cAMP-binding protein